MQTGHTWRTLLGSLVKEPHQRQLIASELGINPLTLTRWIEKKSTPRPERLTRLLTLFPAQRTLFLELLHQDFPSAVFDTSMLDEPKGELSAAFYHEVFDQLSTLSPQQLIWSPCQFVLHHALEQLDPQKNSVALFITHCIPPSSGHAVRSLRSVMGLGVSPWGGNLEHQSTFLGANTTPGRIVSSGHSLTVQNYQDPFYGGLESQAGIASSCTYPLLRANQILGTFGATSLLPNYFTPARQQLIQRYATLLSVLFATQTFYSLSDIRLQIMPPAMIQLSHIATFQSRVRQLMLSAVRNNQPLSLMQAEQRVWQDLEEELLQLVSAL